MAAARGETPRTGTAQKAACVELLVTALLTTLFGSALAAIFGLTALRARPR